MPVHFFSFPLNAILVIIWIVALTYLYDMRKGSRAVRFLLSWKMTILTSAAAVAVMLFAGFLTDAARFIVSWGFFAVFLLLMSHLYLVLIRGWKDACGKLRWRFIFNHLGLLVVLVAGFFGCADSDECRMRLNIGVPVSEAYREDGSVVFTDFSFRLDDFSVDYYENGAPSRYAATLTSIESDGRETAFSLEVNSPYHLSFAKSLYLSGYDEAGGSGTSCVVLLVNEPWRYAVLAGIILLLLGAVLMLLRGPGKKDKWLIAASVVLGAVFLAVTCIRVGLHKGTPVPALQSVWFSPHVISYMFSYSLFAIAAVTSVCYAVSGKESLLSRTDATVYMGFAFMTFGLLSGAVWAKEAWGHYWSWDPKEIWAAATWVCYLIYIHLRQFGKGGRKLLCGVLVFAFLCMQMCWYGVNYLSSAKESVHSYIKR